MRPPFGVLLDFDAFVVALYGICGRRQGTFRAPNEDIEANGVLPWRRVLLRRQPIVIANGGRPSQH
jgi:hypothetical protein